MEQGTGPGRVLGGRYRIEGMLGRGGFGLVWAAYDEFLHVRVAIESLGAAGSANLDLARAVTRVRGHPNLVPVHDVVEANGALWRVRPFVPDWSLDDYLAEQRQMPDGQVRELAMALLDALEAMHTAGVVHGDVRPANIRRDGGRWVLLPGVSGMARDDDDTIDDGLPVTTDVGYVAPELLSGASQRPSSDLFSLGATLYHLLAGRAPFHQDDDFWATLAAVVREEPPPLDRSGELALLVERLLDKNPESRLTTAQARRLLSGSPDEDPLAAAQEADPRMSPMNHAIASSSLLVLLLAAALAWAAIQANVTTGRVSDFLVSLLPWVVFAFGLGMLARQARTALTRRPARERVSVWRFYVRSLAPPERWTAEERSRRRAAAERAVDGALLRVDQRMSSASGVDRGANDV